MTKLVHRPTSTAKRIVCCKAKLGADKTVLEVLTLLRKNNVRAVSKVLAKSQSKTAIISSRDAVYRDNSVLSDHCDVFDVGSRRVLPSNLLRRSQVLSVLPMPGIDSHICHVRTKVCSKSGEEGVILWKMISGEDVKDWRISSARLEDVFDDVPSTLHPRYSPESIIRAYLLAMKKQEYVQAQYFCHGIVFDGLLEELSARGSYSGNDMMLFMEPTFRECMEALVSRASHCRLVDHGEWIWGEGLLSDQQHMIQEVVIKGKNPRSDWQHWLFHIGIHDQHGCWTINEVKQL